MDIRNCPGCGTDEIGKSSGSKEYSSYVRWTCERCDWSYQKGRGMGWYDTKGTHPRELTSSDQSRLTKAGMWCSNCETVEAPPHACTARQVVEKANDPVPLDDVREAIEEYHYNPTSQIRDEFGPGGIQLTPTFFRVTTWDTQDTEGPYVPDPVEPEIADAIRHEIREHGGMNIGELCNRLAPDNDIASGFIRTAAKEIDDVVWGPMLEVRIDEDAKQLW